MSELQFSEPVEAPDAPWLTRGHMRVPGGCHMSPRPELVAHGIGAAMALAERLACDPGLAGAWWIEVHHHLQAAHAAVKHALEPAHALRLVPDMNAMVDDMEQRVGP